MPLEEEEVGVGEVLVGEGVMVDGCPFDCPERVEGGS